MKTRYFALPAIFGLVASLLLPFQPPATLSSEGSQSQLKSADFLLAQAAGSLTVNRFGYENAHDSAEQALFGLAASTNLQINGLTKAELTTTSDTPTRNLGSMLGSFSNGAGLVGLESGLVVVPGWDAEAMLRTDLPEIPTVEPDPSYLGSNQAFQPTEFLSVPKEYPDTVIGALAKSIDSDLNVPQSPLGGKNLFDPVSLSFDLVPSARYLKLDFVLAMTETGSYDPETEAWTGFISQFPDGLGIFVKSAAANWLDADTVNCAAIPTTNSYLSMYSAGILPPDTIETSSALAVANYRALVQQTAVPGYKLNPEAFVDSTLTEPTTNLIPPPMIAYNTGESGTSIRFVTTTLTCVVDVEQLQGAGEISTAQSETISVGLAVANLYDQVLPPAMFVSASSIRFSSNPVAAEASVEQEIIDEARSTSAPAPFMGPIITSVPAFAVAGGSVTLTGSRLDLVTSASVDGLAATIVSVSEASLTLVLSAELTLGAKSLELGGSFGSLSIQQALIIVASTTECASANVNTRGWTRGQPDGTVKMYARGVIGECKVSLRVNGREIAWVRAVDATDPKLNLGPAGQKDGLVRTITLAPGKNALEIFVDGTRIWRAAYTGR